MFNRPNIQYKNLVYDVTKIIDLISSSHRMPQEELEEIMIGYFINNLVSYRDEYAHLPVYYQGIEISSKDMLIKDYFPMSSFEQEVLQELNDSCCLIHPILEHLFEIGNNPPHFINIDYLSLIGNYFIISVRLN